MSAEDGQQHNAFLTAVAMLTAALTVAHHVAGKATRDALFLSHFDVARLPLMMMASAALSVIAVLLMSRLLARFGPARLIPPLFLASAALFAGQWVLSESRPQLAAAALYLQVAALNSILISGFWSVLNERFDPYSAKQVIARVAAAATFGGLAGGLISKLVADAADAEAVLLALAAMHLACGFTVWMLARGSVAPSRAEDQPAGSLLAPLQRSGLIRRMALLGLLVATTAAVLDYILKAQAVESFSEEELITFFSYFYVAVGLGTFLLQSALGNRALRWFGLGGTMAAWPLVILATGGFALVARSLLSIVLLRASANLLYNSFFRAGFELLYTPIAPADKRSGKVLIDVGADRSGDLLGGLLVMGILLLPAASQSVLLVSALALAGLCLLLILVLHRDYVRQLARNLRSGELELDEVQVLDATTASTVASTQTAIQRDQLLREIERFRAGREAAREPPAVAADAPAPGAGGDDAMLESITALRGDDPEARRRVLSSRQMTPALLPHVIPLLAEDEHLREALRALRRAAPQNPGLLVDALLAPLQHPLVKRRLPLALAHADSPLAVTGLERGLDDADWNVRFRCARALETLRRRNPESSLDRGPLLAHARAEAEALARESAAGKPGEPGRDRLELVFLLLGAAFNPETLALCRQALAGEDRALRGTALEYLENRLPGELWALLRPRLSAGPVPARTRRPLKQVTRELYRAVGRDPEEDPGATNDGSDALD